MKKKICMLVCLTLISSVITVGTCGCSAKKSGQYQSAGVNEVLEQGMAEADSKNTENAGPSAESSSSETKTGSGNEDPSTQDSLRTPDESSKAEKSSEGIDVDLTLLSSTMVYSEVYNMMTTPEKYIGKTVKIDGLFAYYHDESTDNNYFACIIQDATACCSQGIEFVLTDNYTFPDDYPEVNTEICVVGIFDTYQEGDTTYCTLRNAKLL